MPQAMLELPCIAGFGIQVQFTPDNHISVFAVRVFKFLLW